MTQMETSKLTFTVNTIYNLCFQGFDPKINHFSCLENHKKIKDFIDKSSNKAFWLRISLEQGSISLVEVN